MWRRARLRKQGLRSLVRSAHFPNGHLAFETPAQIAFTKTSHGGGSSIAFNAALTLDGKAINWRASDSMLYSSSSPSADWVSCRMGPEKGPPFDEQGVLLVISDKVRILLGELSHFGTEWHSEAGGGKTFCLSAFLEVVGLGRFPICHALPPPASIQYATFHATFYATVSKRTLTATTGEKDSNHHRQLARWVGST